MGELGGIARDRAYGWWVELDIVEGESRELVCVEHVHDGLDCVCDVFGRVVSGENKFFEMVVEGYFSSNKV